MKFNETQLNWIERNKELINNRDLAKLRPRILYEDIENYEKRQLLAGLALIFDLPLEILKAKKKNSTLTYFPLFINGWGDRIKLVEFSCMGDPGKSTVIDSLKAKLVTEGIDGEILKRLMEKVKYNVD